MSRGPSTFRQRDMAAAIKAARQAGCEVVKVEVDKEGKIVVWTSGDAASQSHPANEWDEVTE